MIDLDALVLGLRKAADTADYNILNDAEDKNLEAFCVF